MFTAEDYRILHGIVFNPSYPGYKPNVIESPNGDGVKDTQKRYAHVSQKYYMHCAANEGVEHRNALHTYLNKAHNLALDTAVTLGIPPEFWPDIRYSALRVLEYPPGAGSAEHTDFDLFTLNLYRNVYNPGLPDGPYHVGELLEVLDPTYFKATEHSVSIRAKAMSQFSIIYFAMPDEAATLPTGQTVGDWVKERKERSRYDV